MTDTNELEPIDPLIREEDRLFSQEQGMPILCPDYPLSLRKRVHVGYDPIHDDAIYTNTIAEALAILSGRGHAQILIICTQDASRYSIQGQISLTEA